MFVLHFLPLNVDNLIHARPEACFPSSAKCPVSELLYNLYDMLGGEFVFHESIPSVRFTSLLPEGAPRAQQGRLMNSPSYRNS